MLELLTGRRSTDKSRPKSEQSLVHWAKAYSTSSQKFRSILDPKLVSEYSVKGVREVSSLALTMGELKPKRPATDASHCRDT